MIHLAVIFGSKSVEHEVSIVTAVQLMHNADPAKYNVIPVYITPEGIWHSGDALKDIEFYKTRDYKSLTQVWIDPVSGARALWHEKKGLLGGGRKEIYTSVDIAVPALHGMNGEDGTVQGLLELADIPYTSAGVLGSALGMDKIAMHQAFQGAGLPVVESCWFERGAWREDARSVIAQVEKTLRYPVFVKPANLGSSIGISRGDDAQTLNEALEVAFSYDRRVIVEQGIANKLEINCAALGYGRDVKASLCEQPISWQEYLSFEEKYLSGGKTGKTGDAGGMENMSRIIPAPIGDALTARVQDMTVQAFKLLDCKGVVRVDYMIDRDQNDALYINEINTIPGSFAFYLWEPMGIPYASLIDSLVDYALLAHREKNENSYAYQSDIIQSAALGLGSKGAKGSAGKL